MEERTTTTMTVFDIDQVEETTSSQSQTSVNLTEADCDKLRKDICEFVLQLEKIIKSVDATSVANSSDETCGLSSSHEQPTLLEIIKAALHEIEAFLETPFGKNASALFNKYSSRIGLLGLAVNFTQVTAGVVVVNLFLDIANKLLQVREDDFRIARKSIENSLKFIKEKLPEIKQGVHDAGEVFKKIRETPLEDEKELNHRLSEFKGIIKTTELNIKHCDKMLESADLQIEKAMRKIAAHAYLNGAVRGAVVMASVGGICYLRKKAVITSSTGVVIGVVGLILLFVRIQPQYQKEKEDFLEYKVTQDDLKRRLSFLSDHLKGHEDSFNDHVRERSEF